MRTLDLQPPCLETNDAAEITHGTLRGTEYKSTPQEGLDSVPPKYSCIGMGVLTVSKGTVLMWVRRMKRGPEQWVAWADKLKRLRADSHPLCTQTSAW